MRNMLFSAKKINPDDLEQLERTLPVDAFRIHFETTGAPRIEATTPAARFYAENYLTDLQHRGELPQTPQILEDSPRFQERGFMLDVSRDRVPTMDSLLRLIDKLGRLRYNQLQLYTEHTFAFKNHEKVWKDASPFTEDEIHQLEDYCEQRHIELVPNQNCFGHMERWLKHAEYHHLAECPNGFEHPTAGHRDVGTTLHPSDQSESFVREILTDVLPVYRSKKANIGGDEPWELGQGRSHDEAVKIGKHEVYLRFLKKIFSITEELGKEPIFWADILLERPELVHQIPSNAVPAIWGYHPSHPYTEQCRIIADAGFRDQFQVVPGTNTWNSFTGRLRFAAENIQFASREGFKNGARGMVLTCWGDGGHHQSSASLYPSLILAAQAMWESSDDAREHSLEILPREIDFLFYADEPTGNGEAICSLGEVDDLLPYPNHNQSFLHYAFFADSERIQSLSETVGLDDLSQAESHLSEIDPENLDPCVSLSREMSLWAIERCRHCLGHSQFSGEDLVDWLQSIHSDFKEIWLRDSRPGGLKDSLDRFPLP
tara:strand:+ start:5663 stop:7297 length:1635 start_codon:yes stop_codon:yes gene_type:complete